MNKEGNQDGSWKISTGLTKKIVLSILWTDGKTQVNFLANPVGFDQELKKARIFSATWNHGQQI